MRETWIDERLDDLNTKVDEGFDKVDRRFDRMDDRITALGTEINARFDTLQRTMIQFAGVLVAALLGVIATQL